MQAKQSTREESNKVTCKLEIDDYVLDLTCGRIREWVGIPEESTAYNFARMFQEVVASRSIHKSEIIKHHRSSGTVRDGVHKLTK